MAYRSNPFLERMSERTTTDQEFVRLFSPRILDRLGEDALDGAVHIFRSPPGGGKTTLLRAFTPTALRAFWNGRRLYEMADAYQALVDRGVLHDQAGPQLLGVLLSCASGYADLPPGASISQDGLFRALLDCRIVLRTLRSLLALLGMTGAEQVGGVRLGYADAGCDLKAIPDTSSVMELLAWAERRERAVYAQLDGMPSSENGLPNHVRFEGVLWLQHVQFIVAGEPVALRRLLMIDDLHKLRRKQRGILIQELSEMRSGIPIWLAERTVALGDGLLSPGVRDGRDVREYSLEQIWTSSKFSVFAQNVLDRRLSAQSVIPSGSFAQYLRSELEGEEGREELRRGRETLIKELDRYRGKPRYAQWVARAETLLSDSGLESLRELYVTRILLMRDERKRQMTLDLIPLQEEELGQRDSSAVQGAADLFIHEELRVPYYFGLEQVSVMATNNVEELLSLAGALYDGLRAKQVLRRPELVLSPGEQERVVREVARRKREFIPKMHTEGTRAQRLLDAIGQYCRERTFLPNAPYAPGVTGVRLSDVELAKLEARDDGALTMRRFLRRILTECVAENLLVARPSAASTSRRAGLVFYMNRLLCAHYGLPLQMGGWQDVTVEDLCDWMERGAGAQRRLPEVK